MDGSTVDYLLNLEVDTDKICAHCYMSIRGNYSPFGSKIVVFSYDYAVSRDD